MKVRITETPAEFEMDGVRLDNLLPGTVRDVSPSIGAWLMAAGYAQLEMRQQPDEELDVTIKHEPYVVHDRRSRRR